MRGAEQPAGGVVEAELAGGGGLDAHLVLEGGAQHAVAHAGFAGRVGQEFGDQEQADAFDAGRGVQQAGEDEVDDVLGQVVFAGGDEDLVAGDAVGAVVLRGGLGAQQAEIGAAMGFGEAHGAGPGAGDHLGEVELLQLVAGVVEDRLIGAMGQAGIEAEAHVGGARHLLDLLVDDFRQALTAVLRRGGQRGPAAFAELAVRVLKPGGRADDAVFVGAAFLVAAGVQRQQHALGEFAGFFQDGVD